MSKLPEIYSNHLTSEWKSTIGWIKEGNSYSAQAVVCSYGPRGARISSLKKFQTLYITSQYIYVGNHFKGRELPGDPVVWALYFHFLGLGSIPGQETEIP